MFIIGPFLFTAALVTVSDLVLAAPFSQFKTGTFQHLKSSATDGMPTMRSERTLPLGTTIATSMSASEEQLHDTVNPKAATLALLQSRRSFVSTYTPTDPTRRRLQGGASGAGMLGWSASSFIGTPSSQALAFVKAQKRSDGHTTGTFITPASLDSIEDVTLAGQSEGYTLRGEVSTGVEASAQ